MGTRLGVDRCKALVEFSGRTLLEWQLAAVPPGVPVVVGTGFQAEEVSEIVAARRPGARTVFNPAFATTGPAATLALAAQEITGRIISWSGDVLVHPKDLRTILSSDRDCVAVTAVRPADPIGVQVDDRSGSLFATKFLTGRFALGSAWEWACIASLDARAVPPNSRGSVYELLEPTLPVAAVTVRSHELDHPSDRAAMDLFVLGLRDLLSR